MSQSNAAVTSRWATAPVRPPARVTPEQIAHYDRHGYLLVDGVFSPREVRLMKAAAAGLLAERSERTVMEASGAAVRSVYRIHDGSATFSHLARHPRLVEAARGLLDGEVYLYQSKLNSKAAFDGDSWPWHQDYVFWLTEDGMPAPRALTAAVFLDDVTELNGPMMVIPETHREGVLAFETCEDGGPDAPAWMADLVARLKFTIDRRVLRALADDNGVVSLKGRAGSVLFFDCNLAHASPANLSPYERGFAMFTYNHCDNAPPAEALQRPEFLVERDTRPIVTVPDHALRDVGA